MRKKINKGRGFALVEVLLAVVIVSVGLVFVLQSFAASVNALKTSRDYHLAGEALDRIMNNIENGRRSYDAAVDSTFHIGNREYHLTIEPVSSPFFTGLRMQEVHIRIDWGDGKRELAVSTIAPEG